MTAEEFFQTLKQLIESAPFVPTHQVNCEMSEYADHIYYSRYLKFCFDCLKCESSIYLYDSVSAAKSVDCDYIGESELCYQSVDAFKCFNCDFIEDSSNLTDCSYCVKCANSHDMFGCVNMRNKAFCIFNRQLSESEYREKVKIYKTWPWEKVLSVVSQIKSTMPVTQTHEDNNENSSFGDYVYFSKNTYMCFDSRHNKDSGYVYDSHVQTTCYDITYCTENELCYEFIDSGHCFNCDYVVYSANCQDSSYVINCYGVKNCLGAVNKDHVEYEILNKKYSKEEYEVLSKEILDDIRRKKLGWADLKFH